MIENGATVPVNTSLANNTEVALCQVNMLDLVGQINVTFNMTPPTFEEMENINPPSETGLYTPDFCTVPTGHSVAIIIPFRDTTQEQLRTEQLKFLLHYMIPILQRQKIMFRFYIINQLPGSPFNRAKLLNIGFLEAIKELATKNVYRAKIMLPDLSIFKVNFLVNFQIKLTHSHKFRSKLKIKK